MNNKVRKSIFAVIMTLCVAFAYSGFAVAAQDTEGHVHTDACWEHASELKCGLTECEEKGHELICELQEPILECNSDHEKHYATCYKYPDGEIHFHSEECYTAVHECNEDCHHHTDDCYNHTDKLICGYDDSSSELPSGGEGIYIPSGDGTVTEPGDDGSDSDIPDDIPVIDDTSKDNTGIKPEKNPIYELEDSEDAEVNENTTESSNTQVTLNNTNVSVPEETTPEVEVKENKTVQIEDEEAPLANTNLDEETNSFPWWIAGVIAVALAGLIVFFTKRTRESR